MPWDAARAAAFEVALAERVRAVATDTALPRLVDEDDLGAVRAVFGERIARLERWIAENLSAHGDAVRWFGRDDRTARIVAAGCRLDRHRHCSLPRWRPPYDGADVLRLLDELAPESAATRHAVVMTVSWHGLSLERFVLTEHTADPAAAVATVFPFGTTVSWLGTAASARGPGAALVAAARALGENGRSTFVEEFFDAVDMRERPPRIRPWRLRARSVALALLRLVVAPAMRGPEFLAPEILWREDGDAARRFARAREFDAELRAVARSACALRGADAAERDEALFRPASNWPDAGAAHEFVRSFVRMSAFLAAPIPTTKRRRLRGGGAAAPPSPLARLRRADGDDAVAYRIAGFLVGYGVDGWGGL